MFVESLYDAVLISRFSELYNLHVFLALQLHINHYSHFLIIKVGDLD